MLNIVIFYTVSLMILFFVNFFLKNRKPTTLEKRKNQAKSMSRGNILKEKIEEITTKKVKLTKRRKIEDMCVQAGFDMKYVDYVLVSITSGVIFTIIFGIVFMSPLFGILFFIFGMMAPKPIIGFVRNKRLELLDKQIGAFMQMVIKRYENTRNFHKALEMTSIEFKGEEPMYTELNRTLATIDSGTPIPDAIDELARRTGNKYMDRFSAYYRIVSEVGTDDLVKDLLNQAYVQFDENRRLQRVLKREISGAVQESYIMVIAVPAIAMFQSVTNPDYIHFMTRTFMGQAGTAGVIVTLLGVAWLINTKLGAPLD